MDYEKKYNEALERAKELRDKALAYNANHYVKDYETIFPELHEEEKPLTPFQQCLSHILYKVYYASAPGGVDKFILDTIKKFTDELVELAKRQEKTDCQLRESEDERMIKAILSAIRGGLDTEKFLEKHGTNYEEVEAYLEKQKEIPMPNSTELIEMWEDVEATLKEHENDPYWGTWRIAYNAFLEGFGKGYMVKRDIEKQKDFAANEYWRGFGAGRDEVIANPDAFNLQEKQKEQKEQKPSFGIYWHKIKKGEKLPCRAYVWNLDYEKHYDCFEGRLIANLENISVGSDTWYLPADDVRNIPREGVDELPMEQKPAEWSEEDEAVWMDIKSHMIHGSFIPFDKIEWIENRLKSLRPSWKPSKEQMEELMGGLRILPAGETYHILLSLYNDLKKL